MLPRVPDPRRPTRRRLLAMGTGVAAMSALGPRARAAPAGLRVPPEEAPHAMTFMQWPVSPRVYGGTGLLGPAQQAIASIANAVSAFEPVIVLAQAAAHAQARRLLSDEVRLWDIPTEDLWCRDAGPLFAFDTAGKLVVSHIRFNGWGGKQVHRRDGQVAARVAERLGVPLIDSGLSGEAGGVESDGDGTLIAHESSWVIANRNPGLDRDQVAARLCAAYGAERVVWAPGLRGQDITDYHIDSLARFTGPGRVLMNLPAPPDPRDPFHAAALRTEATLRDAGLDVTVIPEPDPDRRRVRDAEFVASYANCYVCNGAVMVAQFGDPDTDARAVDALARAYPGRAVVALQVDALGHLGGGIHCATQQVPGLPGR